MHLNTGDRDTIALQKKIYNLKFLDFFLKNEKLI